MTKNNDWPPQLSELFIPEASPDFAARIIAGASPKPESSPGWRHLLMTIFLPKPALGIAFGLIFGIGVGWQASASSMISAFSTEPPVAAETILDTFHFDSGEIL